MSIDKYDPIRVLGEGSFGKVYLMRDKVRRTFVCVKVIKIKNIPKKEREATKMEVDLLRRLHHPNIVRYIDSFLSKNNESLCICMEYCDGVSSILSIYVTDIGRRKIMTTFLSNCWYCFSIIDYWIPYYKNRAILLLKLKRHEEICFRRARFSTGLSNWHSGFIICTQIRFSIEI